MVNAINATELTSDSGCLGMVKMDKFSGHRLCCKNKNAIKNG